MLHHILLARLKRLSLLRMTLLSMGMLDEIITGFLIVGLPLVRDQLRLSYGQVGLLFTVSALSSLVFDPIISLLSDQGPKRYWIIGGLLVFALCFVLAGNTRSFLLLLVALALMSPSGSAAIGLSQAALIDFDPANSSPTMARWTLMSSIGDFLAPLIVTAMVSLRLGWTDLCWLATSIWLGTALAVWSQPFPTARNGEEGADGDITLLAGLREALRDPALLRWAVLATVPTMVDEVFLGFVALYLRDVLHASQAMIGLIVAIHTIGAFLGLFALDRFLLKHVAPRRLIMLLSLLVLAGMIGLLSVHLLWVATVTLFIIGLGASGWYPIAKGQAYSRLPGRSGTVRAVVNVFSALDVALPGIVGIIAGRFGIVAGVGFLALAPVLMLLLLIGHKE